MVPPRLKLVSSNENIEQDNFEDTAGDAEARELAAALADPQLGIPSGVAELTLADRREKLRIVEAVLFASSEPLDEAALAAQLPAGAEVSALIEDLRAHYATRGVNLVKVAGKWAFRTAEDLSYLLERHASEERKLSKAALETLAIIAYHQPVTRAEIEDVRGVATSPGTLEILLETAWIRPRGRRRAPGKPITYGTTDKFLQHFGLDSIKDLPGIADLKAQGLLDNSLPSGFTVPEPTDVASLMPDELPLDAPDPGDDVQAEMALPLPEDEEPDTPEPGTGPQDDPQQP